ncbi:hypothetical protein DPMN_183495 [Dreissena polymorpha]|uniref:Uncharacterized protein n=1 Tax=Dreissena polymorpha TaxID=45954 RepID=A0A9D4I3M5_DREPO|nr:hypothetical protein DPMN_183495 [Dreissena polymorpha]
MVRLTAFDRKQESFTPKFVGTSPFLGKYSHECRSSWNSHDALWVSFEHVHLKTFIEGLPGQLEYEVGESGQNLRNQSLSRGVSA